MKNFILIIFIVLSVRGLCQQHPQNSLFGKDWKSPYAATISEGAPVQSAFPSGFQFTKDGNKVFRYSYMLHPLNPADTFSTALDTLDLKKKVTAFSKAGRKMETTISISKDEKQINIKRDFFYAYDPKKLEFSYDEVYRLLENGDAILEKTSKSPDPDSQWNFVGTKTYPKDGQVKQNN